MPADRRRALLFTSGPLEGSEGADRRIAAMVAGAVPDTEFGSGVRRAPAGCDG